MRISHEAIYQALFVQGRGALRRELTACLRTGAVHSSPILTSSNPLSTLHRRFACARLSQPCLRKSCPGVSATLATIAFDNSSLRWLADQALDCRPRRALLHLPYSCVSPFGPAILVTHVEVGPDQTMELSDIITATVFGAYLKCSTKGLLLAHSKKPPDTFFRDLTRKCFDCL